VGESGKKESERELTFGGFMSSFPKKKKKNEMQKNERKHASEK
jgi:hypothetical protein